LKLLFASLRRWLVLLAGCWLLWWLAYQVPFRWSLAIGGDPVTHLREYDAPFLRGFHHAEPTDPENYRWWTLEPGYSYRWTTGEATVCLPGIGGGQWVVRVLASSGRPAGETTTSTWQVGKQLLPPFELAAAPRTYHLLARANAGGDLVLQMDTPTYMPPDDPRPLGFAMRELRVVPADARLRVPSLVQAGWLSLVVLLTLGLCRWLVCSRRSMLLLGGGLAVGLAVLLASYRFTLTLFAPRLVVLLLVCWGLALAMVGVARLLQRFPVFRADSPGAAGVAAKGIPSGLIVLVLLAFALRMGGMLHPYAVFSDHRLHANNVLDVLGMGNVYFTEGLPAEAGGGQSPYPPGTYLVTAPAQVFLPASMDGRVVAVQGCVALLDSLVLVFVWGLLRGAGLGRRVALWGGALYLAPAPLLRSFSTGEYANIGGQALALPALSMLVFGSLFAVPVGTLLVNSRQYLTQRREGREGSGVGGGQVRWQFVGFLLLLALAWLGHMGVALSLGLLLVAWWLVEAGRLLWLWRRQGGPLVPLFLGSGLLRFTLAVGLAGGLVALVYYTAPLFQVLLLGRLQGASGGGAARQPEPVLQKLAHIVRGLFSPHTNLVPVLIASGAAGVVLLWQQVGRANQMVYGIRRALLVRLLGAWWLGTLLAIALEVWFVRQGVRWQHFLYPALCLGAAPLLVAFVRRGRAGRLLAWGVVVLTVCYGVLVWVVRIGDYLH
jgi:hypothetical protein